MAQRRSEIRLKNGQRAWVQYDATHPDSNGNRLSYIVTDWSWEGPAAEDTFAYPRTEHATNIRNWGLNVPENMARMQHTVAELRGSYAGKPGYVIATGPSLEYNIGEIAKIRNGAVIGVNDTAKYPAVARYLSHYVVMDGGGDSPLPATWADFAAERNGSLIPMFNIQADHHLCSKFHNVHYFRNRDNPHVRLPEMPGATIDIPRTVSHSAVHLAYLLGCNPIVLIGQDCAFTDMKLHAYEPLTAEYIVSPAFRSFGPHYYGSSPYNGKIYSTCELFVAYKWALEAIGAMLRDACGVSLINASEGGILGEGMECQALSAVVAEQNRRS